MGRIIMTEPAVSPSSSMVCTPHSVTYSVRMPLAPRSRSTASMARSSSAYACFCSGLRGGTEVRLCLCAVHRGRSLHQRIELCTRRTLALVRVAADLLVPVPPRHARSALPALRYARSEEHTSELPSLMRISYPVL